MCGEQQLEEMRAALVGLGEAAQLGKADALNARCAAATPFSCECMLLVADFSVYSL